MQTAGRRGEDVSCERLTFAKTRQFYIVAFGRVCERVGECLRARESEYST